MNILQAVRSGFRNYANFQGRAVRSEYWYWALFAGVVTTVAPLLDQIFFPDRAILSMPISGGQFGPIYVLSALALMLPAVTVAARRLHDVDRSAWWLLLWLTGIGGVVLLYWFCRRGTAGGNRFGPVPLEGADPKTLSLEMPAGQSPGTAAGGGVSSPKTAQPIRTIPLWLKISLIVVAAFVLLTGGAALAVYVWVQKQGTAVTAAGDQGAHFGANKDRAACVDEAVARIRRGSGVTEAVKDRVFLEKCLKEARPVTGFCDNVPAASETAASSAWQERINKEHELTGLFDQSVLLEIQSVCDADRRKPRVSTAQPRLPQCPLDPNATWTDCNGTRAIIGSGEYVGGFVDGEFDGLGTYTWPDGRKFVGQYKRGKAEGHGEFTAPGGVRYAGNYKNDKRHGRGELTLANGEQYVGEFRNGNFDGRGTYTWPDGRKYEGEFKHGKRDGEGVLTSADGGKYIGGFRNGSFDGRGEMAMFNGQKYVGEFRDGKFEGHGTYVWPSGQKYVGEYRDGKFEGQGTIIWPSGQKYVGEFRDGKRHGMGKLFAADGSEKQSGIWENDLFMM